MELDIKTIRAMKDQLCSVSIMPSDRFIAWIHPRLESNLRWSAGQYFHALYLWIKLTWQLDLSFDECMQDRPWL